MCSHVRLTKITSNKCDYSWIELGWVLQHWTQNISNTSVYCSDDFISINDAPPGDAIIITINLYLYSSLQNIVTKCFREHNKKITFKKS